MPKVQAMYEGYLQNYSLKDGSMVTGWKEKKEIAELNGTAKPVSSSDII